MSNECIICYENSAKSICSTCNACTCITCYKKLIHCPQCRSNDLKLLNLIDEKFLSNITRKIFKFILDKELKNRGQKFSISTDAKKTIIQIVFTLIFKTINIANQKYNNCVISHKHMITAIKSLLRESEHGGLLDNTIRIINETMKATTGLTKIKDLRKIKDLEGIDILSKFVKNNSKHKADISASIVITVFAVYFFPK